MGMTAAVYKVMVPKYIDETVPNELRRSFSTISQIMITFGIWLVALLALKITYFTFG